LDRCAGRNDDMNDEQVAGRNDDMNDEQVDDDIHSRTGVQVETMT